MPERLGGRAALALGYVLAGLSGGMVGLCAALTLSGARSSSQHPVGSAAVARAYGNAARKSLGTYNFAGDLGKTALPALTSLPLTLMPRRSALWLLGLAVAVAVQLLMPVLCGLVGDLAGPSWGAASSAAALLTCPLASKLAAMQR